MGVYRPMTVSARCTAREDKNSRAAEHRLDESFQAIPQHGCIPAEPASVSPGRVIVAPARPSVFQGEGLSFRYFRVMRNPTSHEVEVSRVVPQPLLRQRRDII